MSSVVTFIIKIHNMNPHNQDFLHEGERLPPADFVTGSSWSHGFTDLLGLKGTHLLHY